MFKIYYIEGCPYCMKALKTIDVINLPVKKILVKSEEKSETNKKNKIFTYPQIFYKNKLIGGNDDFHKLIKTSKTICKYIKNKNLKDNLKTIYVLCKHFYKL
tara:strand:- start:13 stop:318 length:306 start_codon:yes stop_codon:yes gene_type:complete